MEFIIFQVQAVLLLLGGQETATTAPSPEFQLEISDKVQFPIDFGLSPFEAEA